MTRSNSNVTQKKGNGSKHSESSQSAPQRISPAVVEKYLKGIKYPSNRENLINKAEENSAPTDVIKVLNKFKEKQYHSTIDVSKEIGAVR